MNKWINSWKTFEVSFLFYKQKIKKYSNIPDSVGSIPFVSCSSKNNGIDSYCDEKNLVDGNCITVSTNGRCFDSFYQPTSFVVSNDVEVLFSKNNIFNKFVALFLITILNMEQHKWTYGRKPKNNKVFTTKILLPIDSLGNPDYQKMGQFMKEKYEGINKDVQANKELILKFIKGVERERESSVTPIWKPFKICNTFNLYSTPSGIDKNKLINLDDKIYPFISRTDKNNGIDIRIGKQMKPLEPGNCLSLGLDTQTVFYQSEEFYTGQNIQILRHDRMNKIHYFFLKTILDNVIKKRYVWGGRGVTLGRFKNELILLPSKMVNNIQVIDLDYIQCFMERIYLREQIELNKHKELILKFI